MNPKPQLPGPGTPAQSPGATGRPLPVRGAARERRDEIDGATLQRACPMCGNGSPPVVWPNSRCAGCDGPLALPMDPEAQSQDRRGRRGAVRRDRDHLARMHTGWPSVAEPVRWRDLSLTGVSLICEAPVAAGRRVRVIDEGFDGVAEVLECVPQGRFYQLHGRLLSAMFVRSSGVFVSIKA